jgi:CheY-like chemotaxis protein
MRDPHGLGILLVEDDPADVRLTREAFAECSVHNTLTVVEDGVQAMQYLRGEAPYEDAPAPDIVLLDLNLPRKSGLEVLAEIKADRRLRRIPVVVLTTSGAEEDVLRSYDLHANCFVTKPVSLEDFIELTSTIKDFWLRTVVLPRRHQR